MGRMALIFWRTAAHTIGMMLAGWIHREQEAVVAYQKEEIRALREMLRAERAADSGPRGGQGCPFLQPAGRTLALSPASVRMGRAAWRDGRAA